MEKQLPDIVTADGTTFNLSPLDLSPKVYYKCQISILEKIVFWVNLLCFPISAFVFVINFINLFNSNCSWNNNVIISSIIVLLDIYFITKYWGYWKYKEK